MHPYRLLGEPIRRRIVEILASGEHTAGEISDSIVVEFGVTPAAVSRHLRVLRDENAVIVRAEWVNRLYRLEPELLERLADELHHLTERWDRRTGVMARDNDVFWPHPQPQPRQRRRVERDDVWRRA